MRLYVAKIHKREQQLIFIREITLTSAQIGVKCHFAAIYRF